MCLVIELWFAGRRYVIERNRRGKGTLVFEKILLRIVQVATPVSVLGRDSLRIKYHQRTGKGSGTVPILVLLRNRRHACVYYRHHTFSPCAEL